MDETNKKTLLKVLALPSIMVGLLILMLPFGLFNVWVVQKFYGWFLLPLGAPHLNVWHIFGLAMLLNVLTPIPPKNKNEGWPEIVGKIIGRVVFGLIALLIGYLIKSHI